MKPATMLCVAVGVLLAGCAASERWTKPGGEAPAAEAAYQECRGAAEGAVEPQARIDQDILATRQTDWQRGGVGRVESRSLRDRSADRIAAIVQSCMQAKGFAKPR